MAGASTHTAWADWTRHYVESPPSNDGHGQLRLTRLGRMARLGPPEIAHGCPFGSSLGGRGCGNTIGMGFWVEDADSVTHEHEAIHQLVDRLHDRFATVPTAVVEDVVENHYHELDANPIREYVPVLVEHAAVDDLRHLTHSIATDTLDSYGRLAAAIRSV